MSTTTTAPKASKKIDAAEILPGDVFSEMSHYTCKGPVQGQASHLYTHHASGQTVELSNDYVEKFLHTASQHQHEVEVGKEDKFWTAKQIAETKFSGETPKEGDVRVPGIRTIWENIHSAQVFQVCFQKQGEKVSPKKLKELRDAQITEALESIEKAKKGKTGVTATATEALKKIQENPIEAFEEGKMRELIGYKVQFTSRDGRYQCVDMELPKGPASNERPVNINTIEWLVFGGVKYIVK